MGDHSNNSHIDRLAEEARKGRLTRRDFMHYSIAAGLAVTTASGLWTKAAAAEPKKGGTLKYATHDSNTGDSHDPATWNSRQTIFLGPTYRSYLTQVNADGTLGPDLAISWEANKDATEWTFKLHPKASFHSGKPVTADDVIASINHHIGEKSTSGAKAVLSSIKEVTKDGDHTVVFKLSSGNADMPWIMTDYHIAICPANSDGSLNWQSGDGSGPYHLKENEWGVRQSLVRHEGWHGTGAYFDGVEQISINDPNARQTAIVTGDVDAVSVIEAKAMGMLKRDQNIIIENVPSGQTVTYPMHCDTDPFKNRDVRNALKLAINRKELVEKIAFGTATIGNDFHISPVQPYWPSDIPQREYDPDQAKSLLKKAGAEGLTVSLSTCDSIGTGAVDAAVLFAENAKRAGINIKVVREPNDGYYANVWLKKPFVMCNWGARPTPDMMFTTAYGAGAPWNESRWQNERFNALLAQAKSELNEKLRAEQYHEMAMIARDDGGTILPMFYNFVYARRSNLQRGEKIGASWEMDGGRASSRWWMA
ncbi:ABC transporter substrate-binding protein [Mesorhizobium sp. PL10]